MSELISISAETLKKLLSDMYFSFQGYFSCIRDLRFLETMINVYIVKPLNYKIYQCSTSKKSSYYGDLKSIHLKTCKECSKVLCSKTLQRADKRQN